MKFLFELLKAVFEAVMPPQTMEDPHVYKWRMSIAGAFCFLAVALAAHIAMACGLVPGWDTAFAKNSEVQSLEGMVSQQRERTLEAELITTMERFCDAAKNPMAKRFQRERVTQLLQQWSSEHGGHPYSLPSCDEM